MKKLIVTALTLCCLTATLAGCKPETPEGDGATVPAPYTAQDLQTIFFTDVAKGLTVDVSENSHLRALLSSMEYAADTATEGESATVIDELEYVLELENWELAIYAQDVVRFTPLSDEGTAKTATVEKNAFAYLAEIVEGTPLPFDGYSADEGLTVIDSKNATATVEDVEGFLDSLSALSFVRLGNVSHYETGERRYTLEIDGDEIFIYAKYVVLDGELYAIHEGDLEFLKELQFSTSSGGYLPWI